MSSEAAWLALRGAFGTRIMEDDAVVVYDDPRILDPAWVPWQWYRWCYPPPQA